MSPKFARSAAGVCLLPFIGLVMAGCTSGTRDGPTRESASREPVPYARAMVDCLKKALYLATASVTDVVQLPDCYKRYAHGVIFEPNRGFGPGDRIVEEKVTQDGHVLRRVEKRRTDAGVLGITNEPGHPARIVADLIRMGADHDLVDSHDLFVLYQSNPKTLAFLLMALEQYKRADGLRDVAVKNLGRKDEYPLLIVASMRILARYGAAEDVALVSRYLDHEDLDVRSAAKWAKALIEADIIDPGIRSHSLPLIPPCSIEGFPERISEDHP